MLLVLAAGFLFFAYALGQSRPTLAPSTAGGFNCSPAPCVLPPTQASEGGSIVTDPLIVTNPLNIRELWVGSFDGNCPPPSALGFHLSRDGGSTWKLADCMPSIITKQRVYWPTFEPSVGYDRNGTAYAAGFYFDSMGLGYGFIAVQRSTDGNHWSQPIIALRHPGQSYPFDTCLKVDTNPGSPRMNSIYLSGIIALDQENKDQVQVSHSTDGGTTWTQAAVNSIQINPEEDHFTRMAVGGDGTLYATWQHCRGKNKSGGGLCPTVHEMFSKSIDGANTWSTPQRMTTVKMPHYWWLPNTHPGIGVSNFPVIAVDNSNGPHSGNLYVIMYAWTGTYLRVQVIRSTNGGTTWSNPVPVAPATDTHDQFFPTISVSPTGLVGVSWLDRRNDPANHNYQAFAAFSDDGGKTFNENWQLTEGFSDPDVNGDYNWMGDYTGNTWAGNKFIAAWMDSSNGVDMQEVVGGLRLK
jgi:hypothetical protein